MKNDDEYFSPFFAQKRNELNHKMKEIQHNLVCTSMQIEFIYVIFIIIWYSITDNTHQFVIGAFIVYCICSLAAIANFIIHIRKLNKLLK